MRELDGFGTKGNPYLIRTIEDLLLLDSEDYLDKEFYFRQENDLDLEEIENWRPIKNKKLFYNGNDFKIFNLQMNNSHINKNNSININKVEYNIGFFKKIEKGFSVKNIVIYNLNIKVEHINSMIRDENLYNVGGLVIENEGVIENCHIKSGEIEIFRESLFGSLVALNNKGEINNCSTSIPINYSVRYIGSGSNNVVGGIVGENLKGLVIECESLQKMKVESYKGLCVGGLVGKNSGEINNSFVKKEMRAARSDGSEGNIGGITGINSGEIKNSYYEGFLQSSIGAYGTDYVGGIAGINNSEIYNTYLKGEVYGGYNEQSHSMSYVGGIAGINNLKLSNSFVISNSIKGKYTSAVANTIEGKGQLARNYQNKSNKVTELCKIDKRFSDSNDKIELYATIISKEMKQTDFEASHWDFLSVWNWDVNKKIPILKKKIVKEKEEKLNSDNVDLDYENDKYDNIWL